MATAIREAVTAAGGRATRDQIRTYVNTAYPDQWQPSTLTAHLYACAVNNSRVYLHHPHSERFLYRPGDGSFEIYDPKRHGENIWAPTEPGDETQVDELLEGSLTLERDLEDTLVDSLDIF